MKRIKIFRAKGFDNLESIVNKWLEVSDGSEEDIINMFYSDNKDYCSLVIFYEI